MDLVLPDFNVMRRNPGGTVSACVCVCMYVCMCAYMCMYAYV